MAQLPHGARGKLVRATRDLKRTIPLPAVYDDLSQRDRVLVREEYEERQEGMCYSCKAPLDGAPPPMPPVDWTRFPGGRSFLNHPVHLHHCHRTGLTLGAVHALCNAVLWQYSGE